MYQVIKNGKEIALLKNPIWIKLQDNGYYNVCEKEDAHGIVIKQTKMTESGLVIDDVVYHLHGKPEIEGVETVELFEIDDGLVLFDTIERQKQIEADLDYLSIMSGVELDV